MGLYIFFAFLSGISALVYQVVWTRLVALLLGSQIEAISIVLVAFFGGLALGSRILGAAADRTGLPLRLFGGLEASAGALAIASPFLLDWIGAVSLPHLPASFRLIGAAALLFPIPFLLGGTSPALTRCAVREVARSASGAGWIVGANTAGAVLGVAIAVGLIPAAGLRATLLGAGGVACLVGILALALARPLPCAPDRDTAPPAPVPGLVLAAAFLAGMATLGLEVLAARAAALLLGSTLYAWGLVLALLLAGLAIGTGFFGGRAARSASPARDLGLVELGAAVTLALGLTWLIPDASLPARGLTPRTLLTVAACILPPALLAGGAFPFFVRLGVRQLAALGRAFGTVSAINTAGGIAGALLAPFLILPWLGLLGGLLACATLNALLAAVFLFRSAALLWDRWARAAGALLLVLVIALPALSPPPTSPKRRVLHLDHGRQASVAVVRAGGLRELIVDGDPEAATGGDALETEELLGVLPLLLHPAPGRFLEVGLGSGITLATAARFPLERIDCVEISESVIRAGRFFVPENLDVTRRRDPRIRIHHGDGRAFLARRRDRYDVIVANTLHPWSIGATGLYSREYFRRVAAALRPGGMAVQWMPLVRIGADHLAAILRTFFLVFPEGGIWWGAENVFLVGESTRGAAAPGAAEETLSARLQGVPADLKVRLGLGSAREIAARRIATAQAVRAALGPGEILTDDRPVLEGRRRPGSQKEIWALLEGIAREGFRADPAAEPMLHWIRSRVARAEGYAETADRWELRAENGGLALARRLRVRRIASRGIAAFDRGRLGEAERKLRHALAEEPRERRARFALGAIALKRGDLKRARRELERLTADHPGFAEGWNLLGAARRESGDPDGARDAFARALEADPFFPEAIANAGLVAAGVGDYATAREMLGRLRAISPAGPTREEEALVGVLGDAI